MVDGAQWAELFCFWPLVAVKQSIRASAPGIHSLSFSEYLNEFRQAFLLLADGMIAPGVWIRGLGTQANLTHT